MFALVNGQLDSLAIELVLQGTALWCAELDKFLAQEGHSLDDVGKLNVDANPRDLLFFRQRTSTTGDFAEFGRLESRVERVLVFGPSVEWLDGLRNFHEYKGACRLRPQVAGKQ